MAIEFVHYDKTEELNASVFFKGLRGKARNMAEEKAEDMAKGMVYSLRFRQHLKGGYGQSPKFNPQRFKFSHRSPKSKKSFNNWKINKTGTGIWAITNTTKASNGYNYIEPLVTGYGWSWKVKSSPKIGNPRESRLVRGANNAIFSDQLPQGLEPWLKDKREELEGKILEGLKEVWGKK